jgi:hypothetical protein
MATVQPLEKESFHDDESTYIPLPSSSILQAFATTTVDPDLDELGSPTDLSNFLPDSGASQHMTPWLADLFDGKEKLNIGVQVADGHVIKCTTVGKIQIEMIDDDGNTLHVALHGCIYVPGLSRRLFSITQFAAHGHKAIIQHNFVTLLFGVNQQPITIPILYNNNIASHANANMIQPSSPLLQHTNDTNKLSTFTQVPDRTRPHSSKKKSAFSFFTIA